MRLHQIAPSAGATRSRKRVGRGRGNGLGKTSGRGHKGQKARAGGSVRIGFESGHIPLYRKLPRRGFNNYNFRVEHAIINLADLEKVDASEIDRAVLIAKGLIRRNAKSLKILGDGELSKALTVTADKFTASAKAKIEKAGGKVIALLQSEPEEAPAEKAKEAEAEGQAEEKPKKKAAKKASKKAAKKAAKKTKKKED